MAASMEGRAESADFNCAAGTTDIDPSIRTTPLISLGIRSTNASNPTQPSLPTNPVWTLGPVPTLTRRAIIPLCGNQISLVARESPVKAWPCAGRSRRLIDAR